MINYLLLIVYNKIMLEQQQTDHEQSNQNQSTPSKALIRIQDDNSHQSTAKYFLNMFYNNDTNNNEQGGNYKLKQIANKNINQKYFPINQYNHNNTIYKNYLHQNSSHNSINLCQILVVCIICILIIFLYFDIKSEYSRQLTSAKLQIAQCIKRYHENQCDNAVQILQQQCKSLKLCYHQQPEQKVKLVVVLAKVMTQLMKIFIEDLGIFGIIGIFIAIGIYWWRPKWGNQNHLRNQNNINDIYRIKRQ